MFYTFNILTGYITVCTITVPCQLGKEQLCFENKKRVINLIIKDFSEGKTTSQITWSSPLTETEAREIGKEFKKKGYYVRLSWHSNDHFSFFYALSVPKLPLEQISAPRAWSELL